MSQKTAKLERKEAAKPKITITIKAMADGTINVEGFPTTWALAENILNTAATVVNNHFIQKAREGKLDDKLSIIESTNILLPDKKSIIMPGGSGPH